MTSLYATRLFCATVTLAVLASNVLGQPDTAAIKPPALWPGDYRHVHKPQLKAIVDGEFANAIAESDRILKKHPEDAESLFFRSVAIANLAADKRDGADPEAAVRSAIAAGVPFQRYLSGMDPWTKPFREGKTFEWLRGASFSGVVAGPMLGNVTDRSAQIWLRAMRDGSFRIRYREVGSNDSQGEYQATELVSITESADRTGVATLTGLSPRSDFEYTVEFEGEVASELNGTFRTAPTMDSPAKFRLAFGGGAAYLPYKEHMWTTIEDCDPDLLLLLGDNVYIDDPTNETYQRYLYYRRQCQPDFRRLVASSAVYSIWDDHDFGKDDCHGGPLVDKPAWKRPVWHVFQENWVNPNYGGGDATPGCWYEFAWGDVQFIMLDGRYYRDPKPDDGSAPTMLGPAQKAWLKQTLLASNARVKVLCSPVPFSGGNPDKWTGFPEERDEIFSFIEANAISGVMMLSADRHRSDLLVHRRKNGRRYYEFMSSKLTNHHTHRVATEKDGALFSYNERCSFGLVEFDTQQDVPVVDYTVINIDGEQKFNFVLKLE